MKPECVMHKCEIENQEPSRCSLSIEFVGTERLDLDSLDHHDDTDNQEVYAILNDIQCHSAPPSLSNFVLPPPQVFCRNTSLRPEYCHPPETILANYHRAVGKEVAEFESARWDKRCGGDDHEFWVQLAVTLL